MRQKPPPSAPGNLSRPEKNAAAWQRWEEAAKKFKGVDDRLMSKTDLRHIFRTRSSYQVRLSRGGVGVFDRTIHGHSEESLLEAMRVRDEALRQWPDTQTTNQVPAHVLRAVGLTSRAIGITRLPSRSVYRVDYVDAAGRRRLRQFYFRVVPEEVAYAAAIEFLQSLHK